MQVDLKVNTVTPVLHQANCGGYMNPALSTVLLRPLTGLLDVCRGTSILAAYWILA